MRRKEELIRVQIDGVLDLHTFRPEEIGSLVPEYLKQCRRAGIKEVRIVHGKGKGILRRSVHSILSRMDEVESFRLAGPESGHWGATMVYLKRPSRK